MQLDAAQSDSDIDLDSAVVVVGCGLAGLTLAEALAQSGIRVLVLESGGADAEPALDELNQGRCTMGDAEGAERAFDEHLVESRCRRLGGSGWLWGGKCAELDPIDFEQRRWIEGSGWPFSYDEIKPFVDRACDLMGIAHFQRNERLAAEDPRAPLIIDRERTIRTALRRFSAIAGRAPDNRFAAFVARIARHPDITICLHATVTRIERGDDGRIVAVGGLAGQRKLWARGRHFVLAAGGLENARLLLAAGLGNEHDNVGRFFAGHAIHRRTHPDIENRFTPLAPRAALTLYLDKDPRRPQGVFQLTANAQRRERLPNCSLTLQPADAADGPIDLYYMAEQLPNRASRVILTAERDSTGLPRLHLQWKFLSQDFVHLEKIMKLMADEFSRHGVAKLEQQFESRGLLDRIDCARHHMGTTRMHVDPAQGVVDAECRVHGIANLHVAGTSLFPTSGVGNPTLTIVALALRLADSLQRRLAAQDTELTGAGMRASLDSLTT